MSSEGGDNEHDGVISRRVDKIRRLGKRGTARLAELRAFSVPVDVAARIYERDKAYFGSVLGSALAFRLFLFMLSLIALAVGIGTYVVDLGVIDNGASDDLGLTGTLAVEVDQALETSQTRAWFFIITGVTGTAWAGKNLASTLVAVSSSAWQLTRRESATTVRVVAMVTGLNASLLLVTTTLGVIRRQGGLAVATTSLIVVLFVYAAGWFFVTLALPRGTSDPGAMLPGALLVGATMMAMQGLSQFYLAPRLDSESQVLGGVGIAAVALGWLFFASRAMVTSLAVNAVVYEQIGSVSRLLLVIPGVRRIPMRFPSVAGYFDLESAIENDEI
ncbi:MAG: YihY/virulence factor BrkB family protein [Acidimicrobiia bacterium]|nr:YihY/virulence factor BrkB family protein [Acidimicrobiia bacterium]